MHEKAARAILNALLPDSGADMKGEMKSYAELLQASGYVRRPKDFDELIRILDSEIRLITPTDPADVECNDRSVSRAEVGMKYYQLAHDYLVPSLRYWLTYKQKETRRGRAELRLAERSALWNARPQNRHLPSWWEHANIRLFTDKKKWAGPRRRMMGKAMRVHGLHTGVVTLLLVAMTYAGVSLRNSFVKTKNSTRAEGLVDLLLNADIAQVPAVISDMTELRKWTDPLLAAAIAKSEDGSDEKLHLALALLPFDETHLDYLGRQLPTCTLIAAAVRNNGK